MASKVLSEAPSIRSEIGARPKRRIRVEEDHFSGFDFKRVMLDKGSGTEIMYPNLYRGLRLIPKDLIRYDTPIVAFNGTIVIPARQISWW